MSLPPELDIGRDDGLTRERWALTMGWIAAKIRALETVHPSWEAAVNDLRQFGLLRLDNAIQPVYDRLVAIAQLGALFRATSATNLAVGTGIKVLAVAEAERDAFAAAAFLGVQKVGDPTVAMWGALQSYNRDTGLLTILVSQAIGDGSHGDWEIFPTTAPDVTHAGRTDNPHGVTPAQIGAPTTAQMTTAIQAALNALKGEVSSAYDTLKKIEDILDPIVVGADAGDAGRALIAKGSGTGYDVSPLVVAATTGALSRYGGGGIPIQGTNTDNNAAAGYVGEVIEQIATGVSMTTSTVATVLSIELSAGDWDIFGASRFVTSGGATVTSFITSISLTPGSVDGAGHNTLFIAGLSATESLRMPHIMRRLLLSETTTVYLTMRAVFASGALEAQGRLIARRAR